MKRLNYAARLLQPLLEHRSSSVKLRSIQKFFTASHTADLYIPLKYLRLFVNAAYIKYIKNKRLLSSSWSFQYSHSSWIYKVVIITSVFSLNLRIAKRSMNLEIRKLAQVYSLAGLKVDCGVWMDMTRSRAPRTFLSLLCWRLEEMLLWRGSLVWR